MPSDIPKSRFQHPKTPLHNNPGFWHALSCSVPLPGQLDVLLGSSGSVAVGNLNHPATSRCPLLQENVPGHCC